MPTEVFYVKSPKLFDPINNRGNVMLPTDIFQSKNIFGSDDFHSRPKSQAGVKIIRKNPSEIKRKKLAKKVTPDIQTLYNGESTPENTMNFMKGSFQMNLQERINVRPNPNPVIFDNKKLYLPQTHTMVVPSPNPSLRGDFELN